MTDVENFLKANSIDYVLHEHPPVYTGEDMEKQAIPGLVCKNLFLRDQKGKRFFLIILPTSKKSDIKKLGELTGAGKLSFANADALQSKLGVEVGAVSPFGLLNDHNAQIEVYIDNEVGSAPIMQFHPNRNTATLELTSSMFHRFLGLLPHTVKRISF